MQLFYSPHISEHDDSLSFNKDESRHIVKVLRKSIGDIITITNGKGWGFNAQLTVADARQSYATIIDKHYQEKRNFKLHLAVAPTKMNERFQWFLEKATEIGVDTITPIICEHSERKIVKLERLQKTIQAAMKQALHYHLPQLTPPIAFQSFISKTYTGQKFIAHCEATKKASLKSVLKPNEDCLILIGPEGDFSVKEIESALLHQFIPVTLGHTRLRTETAAIVACHSVSFINDIS